MSEIPPGRFQTLTKSEEQTLKEVWYHLLKFWGTPVTLPTNFKRTDTTTSSQIDENNNETNKNKRKIFAKFRKNHSKQKSIDNDEDNNLTSTRSRESIESNYSHKIIHESFKNLKPEEISTNFWNFLRTDTPDNLILRFIRARKWNSDKSLAMLANTLHWRLKDSKVDDIINQGDLEPFQNGEDGFALQLKLSKAYCRGQDKLNRPIVHIRPRLHNPKDQSLKDIEKYTLLVIEEVRLLLKEPIDSASILFDLSDFSMSNMDYAPVKFMIGVFESHYPESLGKLLIHKAPWIFPPIWNIIKNWLDPVVAGKISFTKNVKDLENFIPLNYIPKSLGGNDEFEPNFIQGSSNDDLLLKDESTKLKIQNERQLIIEEFIVATISWIESENEEQSDKFKIQKVKLGEKLALNYIELDPYIRSRNYYDRIGALKLGINI
ncbi:hypothetical protein WICMUC_001051 [Wickerhamomyces mucosus]|uniref:CRAL-TRIO domain-containing protein n=1 Tax=Wickerhamomyces mucosus TaxID=1378264 RepID=A0A9P8TI09_9ASCO|nr:hypothetical protein WICMUC_001051 [Wickerhamomyces mucosus]